MAASNSITFRKEEAIVPFGKYSPKNIAAAIEKGADISNARKDVRRVPTKKGSIPKWSFTGSQVLPHKNEIPLDFMPGHEDTANVRKKAKMSITAIMAEKLSHL